MTALALPRPRLWVPTFEPWRLLRPLQMDGQFYPGQPIQFEDTIAAGPLGPVELTTLAFVTSTQSTSADITIPSSAQSGDLAILGDHRTLSGGSTGGDITPDGWVSWANAVAGSSPSNCRGKIAYKILESDDPNKNISGMTGTPSKAMIILRGDAPITNVVASTPNAQATTGNPSSQSVLSGSGLAPLVVVGVAAAASSTVSFSTASPSFDGTISSGNDDLILGYKIYNSSPANHTIDMNDLGTNFLASGYLQVS